MIIGERLRFLRESRNLSQGDIEKCTGLLRCYISRVENGHTVPALETLEKFAGAMNVPLYQLFYEGNNPPNVPNFVRRTLTNEVRMEGNPKDVKYLKRFWNHIRKLKEPDIQFLHVLANRLAKRQA